MLDRCNDQRVVELGDKGSFSGQLKWGNGELIHIDLEAHCHDEGHRDSIAWNYKNGSKVTTLNNDIYHSHIYPQYLIKGSDLPEKYSGFLVRLSNVSEWLLRWSGFEVKNAL